MCLPSWRPPSIVNNLGPEGPTQNVTHLQVYGSNKLLDKNVFVWTVVPDYDLFCCHLPSCTWLPAQALYILLVLVQMQYVAQANTSSLPSILPNYLG